jgi:hypothetical protein
MRNRGWIQKAICGPDEKIRTDLRASTTPGGWHYMRVSHALQPISSANAPFRPQPPAVTSTKIAQKNSHAHKLRKLG